MIWLIPAALLAIAALVCAWAWLICLGRGAPRAVARRALIAAVVFLALAVASIGAAFAQSHHHPLHKDFYRNWKEPLNPDASCCNARIETNGVESGDCEPTQAELRRGDWYAWIRQLGRFERVTDDVIVYERNPNIFDAHVCWTKRRGIICFKPPDTGG